MTGTAVRLDSLTRRFDGRAPAVDALTLDLAPGRITALLGPSGCGKTTTLRMVAGLLEPDGGRVLFDGDDVTRTPPEARRAVMVFQNQMLFRHMSVARNVAFGLRMRGLPRARIDAEVARMLALVQLDGAGAKDPATLSGGQQQRVALARALILAPRVLLLDEPLSSLDPHLRGEMRDLILRLQGESGVTTLIVTHDQEEAAELAQSIALMLGGRLRQHADAATLYARPASRAVAAFFGGTNAVPGRADGGRFLSALGPLVLPGGVAEGPGLLTVRPEAIRLRPPPDAPNRIEATVQSATFLGPRVRVLLRVGEVALTLTCAPAEAAGLDAGMAVAVTLPRDALWVLPPEPEPFP